MQKLKIILCFLLCLWLHSIYAQLNVSVGMTPTQYVQQLLGPGVQISNVTYTGYTGQSSGTGHASVSLTDNNYEYDVPVYQIGGFTNGATTNLGIDNGIVLSTGEVRDAGKPAQFFSNTYVNNWGSTADPDLQSLGGSTVYDKSVLEFDFIPQGPTISFEYVFASEEYPNFVGQQFNDVFGFFLSGPGISGSYSNGSVDIATIPSTATPMAINNVNNGSGACQPTWGGTSYTNPLGPCDNCQYYVDNCGGSTICFGGFTTVLTATYNVTCGQTYHIKLAVGDIADNNWDAAIFLKMNSLVSSQLNITPDSTTICPGGSATLQSTLTDDDGTGTWNWQPDGQTTQNITVSPTTSTQYIVEYNKAGCIMRDTAFVAVGGQVNFQNATPGPCNNSLYDITGTLNVSNPPSSGNLIVEDCNGNQTIIASAPFTQSSYNYTIANQNADGNSCTLKAYFSASPNCNDTKTITAPSPCNNNCIITNFTTNIGACDPTTNTFNLTGTVEFNDAPTTGQLIVEDCNGNNQTFNAPFTSPINYTISNIPSDGAACSITAHFTADASCTATQSYTNPADCTPPCHFDSLIGTIGACDGATNTFTLDGNVYFNHPPTTGTLTIENCDGYSQTFTAPFSSPQPFSISGIPSDGAACTLTATFSADPACTISVNYSNPASCSCVATAGNYDVTVGGSGGLSGGVYHVCYGDDITIQNNGGYTAPNDIGGDPGIPVAYNPGIEYLIYSCPPTIFPPGDFTSDPCFTGYMIGNSGPGGGYILTNSTGNPPPVGTLTNNTFYIVPITMYDTVNGYYSYTNSGVPCYDMGSPVAVQYLPEVTSSNPTEDCNTGTFTVTISGGLPQIDGSSFTASNLTPATASFGNTTCGNNGTIQITGLQNGDMYSFDVADANGCPITISGGPFVGLPTANAGVDDTAACGVLTYTLSATPSVGTGTWTGPAGVTFSNANSPTSTVTVPSAGTYTLTWTEDNSGGCTDNDQVTITFIANPTYTVNIDNANCGNSDGEIDLTAATGQTPYTYSIDNGATNQATGTFSGLAAATYQVLITDAFGCQVSGTETVGNNPGLTITTVTPTNASCHNVCDGELAATISGGTAPFTYAWTDAGGGAVGTNSANINSLCDGTYNLTVTDFNGCTASQNNNVITEPSAIDSSFALSNFCEGTANAASSIATSGGSFSFNPNPGDGATIDAATGAITAGVGGTTYTVQYVATVGACSATAINTVQVYENPTYTAASTDATCGNIDGAITLTTTAGTAPFTYSIDGGTSTQTNGNFTSLGQGTYNVLITDDNGCQVTGTESVQEFGAPTITAITPTNASCHNVCDGELAATISGGTAPFTYTWTDAGGTAVGANSANINSLCDGTYNLTVTDFNGCSVSQNNNIITEPSAIDSSFALSNFCAGTANAASAIATPGGSFSFNPNPGDGATIDAATGTITAGVGGTTYTVQYVATVGACSATATNTVQVYENPAYTPTLTDATCGNDNGAIVLTTTAGAAPFTYSIDNGATTQTNGTFGALGDGTYNILITDDNGCQATGTENIVQHGSPSIVSITPTNPSCFGVCDGSSVVAVTGGETPYSYAWADANNNSVGNTASINNLCDGNYTITVSDFNGCTVSGTSTLTEPDAIDPSFNLTDYCENDANQATNVATPGGTFSFNPPVNDGATISGSSGTIVNGVGGTSYTVEYTATVGGCSENSTQSVTVHPLPKPNLIGDELIGCAPHSVNFGDSAQLPGSISCVWDFGDGTTVDNCNSSVAHTYSSPGLYSVSLTVTSQFGCVGQYAVTDYIQVTPHPVADFEATPPEVGVSNTEIHFNNQSEDASNYSWSFGDGSPLTTEENPIHTFPDDKGKTYTVTLIASNGNAVCNDTISQAIRVKEELIFYVPNTFTPDNDNYNETFQPVFTAGFDPYTYTLLIFDRWGEILFESHNTAVGWDGTYGGKIVQDGTYIWKITFKEAKDMSDKHHTYTGHVNVLR